MPLVHYVTHPDVALDPDLPVPRWPLSERGRARMRQLLHQPWTRELTAVFSSDEQKAIDGAEILCEELGVRHDVVPELGENDRSATGFLPPDEFWPVVERFFAAPNESVRGWERAIDAQARVVGAVGRCAEKAKGSPIAIVAHGGVGSLLLAQVKGAPIDRSHEQPPAPSGSPPGSGGGHHFAFEIEPLRLVHGWRPIDDR